MESANPSLGFNNVLSDNVYFARSFMKTVQGSDTIVIPVDGQSNTDFWYKVAVSSG